jgi:hypothetical protein
MLLCTVTLVLMLSLCCHLLLCLIFMGISPSFSCSMFFSASPTFDVRCNSSPPEKAYTKKYNDAQVHLHRISALAKCCIFGDVFGQTRHTRYKAIFFLFLPFCPFLSLLSFFLSFSFFLYFLSPSFSSFPFFFPI